MSNAAFVEEVVPPADEGLEDEGIDLVALVVALLSEWRIAAVVFVIVAAGAITYVYSLKPQYVATATFLPQEGHTSGDTLAALFSSRGPGALYIGLLRSRSVQDNTIDRLGLMAKLHLTSHEVARNVLAGKSSFTEGADSLITISVRDGNAQDAADIANAYLLGLEDLNDKMAADQSSQTTRFFERQLQQERDELANAEGRLEEVEKGTGLVQPGAQTQLGISNIASLRTQISGLQVQLAALLSGATEANPKVQTLRSQIAQLQQLERTAEIGTGVTPLGAAPAAARIPENTLDLQRVQRDVTFHETLVSSLASQFETARLNQASARSVFQVVDRALAPETKAWPPRKPYLIFSVLAAAVVGIAAIVVKLLFVRVMAHEGRLKHLHALRRAFFAK